MINEEKLKRIAEIKKGNQAKSAYDSYIKEFIDSQLKALYTGFISDSLLSDEKILNIRQIHATLNALEKAINCDIQTGMMASKQLEDLENE